MARNRSVVVSNGNVDPKRVRLSANGTNGVTHNATFIRSSHSLSMVLAKQLRTLAYEKQTSESSIIECALWLFFKNGSADKVLRLMSRADIAPRRRRK